MIVARAIAWLLLLAIAARAETLRVESEPGLIELRVVAATGSDVSWEARQPLDLQIRNYESGLVAVFCGHAPGRIIVVSDVIDWEGRRRDKTTWIVDITKPPGPGPTPPTPPTPVPPEPSRFGLDTISRESFVRLNPEAKAVAKTIASNFRSTAATIAAGGLKSIPEARDLLAARNRETFGKLEPLWRPWLQSVGTAVDKLEDAGKFPKVTDYADALAEIAEGLK